MVCLIALICTERHRIQVGASTKQGAKTRRFDPAPSRLLPLPGLITSGLLPLLKSHSPPRLTNLPGQWLQCQANGSNVCRVLGLRGRISSMGRPSRYGKQPLSSEGGQGSQRVLLFLCKAVKESF